MLAVRLDSSVEDKLTRLAKETGRSKSYYVKEAINNYLEEREEYLLALAVLEKEEPRTSIDDVRKELGLER
ncbi:ribbon-helix-helix domain-containing protein [Oceanispirochaeta sp.]|jgi:RHH-type rel operon transcriptional repressor/antitoxin RelB|uniref:type II toxin-antitoxin system RelB family antitoxin n=1 Tax=Oceanispirochaeta sp. TaxID=2035350 RepID=UPI00260D01E3|nr:ribbon-helix-helix domain-containing protein [Oceanispirochaeta sp.]MDA3957989.1 ribbon-helix-helix domain-containing protein [Oceanispirochaeta sp.]